MTTRLTLDNRTARRVFLDRSGLAGAPSGSGRGEDLLNTIHALGFVQVDSINTVERAHHMILHARRQSYRPAHLRPLLERDRSLFEHWTHDAAIIPTAFFDHWKLRFRRDADRLQSRWKDWHGARFTDQFEPILQQIRNHGPVCSADVGLDEPRSSGGWWEWHPSKAALEYLWRSGALTVTRRDAFRKVYDLTERVLPDHAAIPDPDPDHTIDWACSAALDRLGFGTSGEVAAFWGKVTPTEARDWCARALADGRLQEIDVAATDGKLRRSFAWADFSAADIADPPGMIRILSPFDPMLRDRARAERLFGFCYRIEIFVPAPKRQYGYYVFPVLEADRLIGRIDMKTDKTADALVVAAFWPEAGVTLGKGRTARLQAALGRTARFAGVPRVTFADGWLRP